MGITSHGAPGDRVISKASPNATTSCEFPRPLEVGKVQVWVTNFSLKLKLHGSEEFQVEAARMEVQDEHLVFFNSSGQLIALFLLEDVESWTEIIR